MRDKKNITKEEERIKRCSLKEPVLLWFEVVKWDFGHDTLVDCYFDSHMEVLTF